MTRLLVGVLISLPLFAIDGVVVNATTGRPQAGVAIDLVQPSQQGMVPLGKTTSGAQGEFKIDKQIPPGPGLLQVTYQGTTYNQIITPNMPTTGVQVKVYDSTRNKAVGEPAEHLILFEPSATEIKINETFIFNNVTNTTFNDPLRGSARFYLPAAAVGKTRTMITAPGGMPISRPPVATGQAGLYKLEYPVKPGETRMDVSYAIPAAATFAGKVVPSEKGVHIVTPYSVTLAGDGIVEAGQEPQTQAHIYNVKGTDFNLRITGVGSLRPDQPAAGEEEDTGQPKIELVVPRIYSRMYWVLGLTLGILALGGWMLFNKRTA